MYAYEGRPRGIENEKDEARIESTDGRTHHDLEIEVIVVGADGGEGAAGVLLRGQQRLQL